MARKRGSKKNDGSSKRKQFKPTSSANDSVPPEVPASNSAEQEEPLLQATSREEELATVHWTSPDTVPVEHANNNNSTSSYRAQQSQSQSQSHSNKGQSAMHNTLAATFFSPPVPDFNSTKSPERRPIHTPYSSRKQPLSMNYSDSDCASSSASEASPDVRSNASSSSSRDNTPGSTTSSRSRRHSSSTSGLRDQVRNLDQLLTSPLTAHLGDLADETPSGTLGPIRAGLEDDDMSEEWDHLEQSGHLLRKELESYDMELVTGGSKQQPALSPYETDDDESGSVPPGIARQRLDPLTSPLHPYNLFPQKSKSNATALPKKKTSGKTPPYTPMKEEKKEDSPSALKTPTSSTRTSSAYTSPPRPKTDISQEHLASPKDPSQSSLNMDSPGMSRLDRKDGQAVKTGNSSQKQYKSVTISDDLPSAHPPPQDATTDSINVVKTPQEENNVTIYKSPRIHSSSGKSQGTHNNSQNETRYSLYQTAINASSISHDTSTEKFGDELDELVKSMPLFDSTDDSALEYNNLSAMSNQSKRSNASTDPDYVDPELTQLVHTVQEQLDTSSFLSPPKAKKTKKKKKAKKRRTKISIEQSKSPDIYHDEIIQVVTGDNDDDDDNDINEEESDTDLSAKEEKSYHDESNDEDDGMNAEESDLEKSQFIMQEALAISYDDYSLASKPTPASPPQLTNDLIYTESREDKHLAHPVPLMPQRDSPRKENETTSVTFWSAPAGTTATVTTGATAANTEEENLCDPGPAASLSFSNGRSSGIPSEGTMTSTQAAIAAHTSSSGTPISCISHPSPDTTGAVALKSSDSSPSTATGPRPAPKRPPRTPGNRTRETPPQILTPEQVNLSEQFGCQSSAPTPPSAVSSTRSKSPAAGGAYSTPTRQLTTSDDNGNTPGGKNGTPGSRNSRGSAMKSLMFAPCTALEHLVRTPSPNTTEEGKPVARPFQFVEDSDDSSSSSQSLVPFTPDELNYRQPRHPQFLNQAGESLATGSISWETEYAIPSPPQNVSGHVEMSEFQNSLAQPSSQPGYWFTRRYDQEQKAAVADSGSDPAKTQDTEHKQSDLLSNSQSRMKELQKQQHEIEMQEIKNREVRERDAAGHHSDSEVIHVAGESPAMRRRLRRECKDPQTSNVGDLESLPISPIGRGRSLSFSHRTPAKKSQPNTPTSTKSMDAWGIRSRADGGKSTSTLDAVLAELSEYRPKGWTTPPKVTSSKYISSSTRHLKSSEPSPGPESTPQVYLNATNKSHSSDCEDKPLFVDFENPDSNKSLRKDNKESYEKEEAKSVLRKRRLFCGIVCLVWLIVVGVIITMALLFTRGRNESTSSSSLEGETPEDFNATKAPSISPTITLVTPTPTAVPTTSIPTTLPDLVVPEPTSSATLPPEPVRPPTARPTLRPTGSLRPVSNTTLSLISLLVSRSVDVGVALLDRSSPEYAALQWLAGNSFLETYSDQQKIQRFVLATVYYSLDGDNWTMNTRWLSDWDECRWFSRARRFPVCNSNGNYVGLELGYIDATGTLPKTLGMLSSSLERVDIQGGPRAFLTGTIPSELGHLALMREFRVSNNNLRGTIPAELHRWTFLQKLDLKSNRFTGSLPFAQAKWAYLSEINIEGNYFQGSLPTEIGLCTGIFELSVGDNLLTGLVPSHIGQLTNLKQLRLEQNNFETFPSEVGELTNLETLMFYTNRFTNAIPSEIGNLGNLLSLSLAFNMVPGTIPTEVGLLTLLRDRLDISYNSLTGSIPSEIGGLRRLRK